MRITKQRAVENRERVVEEAGRLFREKGFDGVGVAELMAAAGLTHGGFYNHFASKEDVEAAACGRVFEKSIAKISAIGETAESDRRARDFAEYCARYVSRQARDADAAACPMVAFAGDVSRRSEAVREVYAKGLAEYLAAFAKASGAPRAEALKAFATLVGALTLARSVAECEPALSEEILACVGTAR